MSLYIDIEKTFPDFKLSMQLDSPNGVTALLGGSGCGKSLTLKCIAGIETPDKGIITINGEVVFDSEKRINLPPQKRHVGYLFQNYALFPTMTVWNNIFCVVRKTGNERREIVSGIIKKFQLESVKDLYPRQISGGQQQRTALARILVSEPRILMLDEPFSALDTHLKWHMEQEIASILAEFNGVTVFVSHNRDEVYRLSDKIAIMNNGRIESTGAKEEVFGSPKTLAAALMTGCKNISRAEKIDDFNVRALDWGIDLKTEKIVPDCIKHIGVRAHGFQLVTKTEKAREENTFPCLAHKKIADPFKKIFIFSFNAELASAELQLELDAELNSKEFLLRIPADKIMCLE